MMVSPHPGKSPGKHQQPNNNAELSRCRSDRPFLERPGVRAAPHSDRGEQWVSDDGEDSERLSYRLHPGQCERDIDDPCGKRREE
jgi:hypothetical protein